MTAAEEGLLLLCCRLEPGGYQPLTHAQYQTLCRCVRAQTLPMEPDREMTAGDLRAMGLTAEAAKRVLWRLDRRDVLLRRLADWERQGIRVCTRLSPDYPPLLRQCLQEAAPPALFLRGDLTLLGAPGVAVVGARELPPRGRIAAETVGRLAAGHTLTLISGNARGADQAAQAACLRAGGGVLAVVPDRLTDHPLRPGVLYVSEDGPELEFTSARALERNRLIHALGLWTLAIAPQPGRGGTWSGSVHNLEGGWSPLHVLADGSPGAEALAARGAKPVREKDLSLLFEPENSPNNSAAPPAGDSN